MAGKIDTVIICAAGLGSRLGLDMPKCLVEIGGHPLIYYLLNVLYDVPNIRMVVGFKEDIVMDCVRKIRKDVVFVRNPAYTTTTNSYSLYLGSHDLQVPFLNIDGDMYISRDNYEKFVDKIVPGEDLIGVTLSYTEDAVNVLLDSENRAIGFSREKISNYEWTGIAYLANIKIRKEGLYIYQELEAYLPIQTEEISCFEIDTPQDLEYLSNKMGHL